MIKENYRRAKKLLEADFDEELVALDPQQGNCFGFNAVATSVWRKLESPKSFDQLRDELIEEYDVRPDQCASELRGLLDYLLAKGLIERDEVRNQGDGPGILPSQGSSQFL